MAYRDTTPVPKYGPTPVYGDCETPTCESNARTTCTSCGGDYCFGHAEHDRHDTAQAAEFPCPPSTSTS